MSERVSSEMARIRIRILEISLACGGTHHEALLDLLDAREQLRENEGVIKVAIQHQIRSEDAAKLAKDELDVAQRKLSTAEQHIKELECERDEAKRQEESWKILANSTLGQLNSARRALAWAWVAGKFIEADLADWVLAEFLAARAAEKAKP